ncbi:hypothetical protein NDU88_002227 [Pleurodeles waltl]|uniref:Uncharacterized protein n=1 Tax=Pleurodeles waltl TaxID=8319 RepID=A0AAV7MAD8_PLEWA|nr:hypothetical protein NDU88_002227 [Pleurodeles waltl]
MSHPTAIPQLCTSVSNGQCFLPQSATPLPSWSFLAGSGRDRLHLHRQRPCPQPNLGRSSQESKVEAMCSR